MSGSESEYIERLLRQFYAEQDKFRAYVYAATRNYHATEEILQSIAIVVAQKAAKFDENRDLIGWAMGIAKKMILRWHSENGKNARNIDFEMLDHCLSHTRSFNQDRVSAREEALRICLSNVPDRQKEIMELRYLDNKDCSQIAGHIGRSVQSVYSLLKRLKRELRKCIERKQHQHQLEIV